VKLSQQLLEKVKGKIYKKAKPEFQKELKALISYLEKEFPDEEFSLNFPTINTATGKLKVNSVANIRYKEDGVFFSIMRSELAKKFPKLMLKNPIGMGVTTPKTSLLKVSMKRDWGNK